MLTRHLSSRLSKVVTSLKVAALVSILGAVVLAAEHRLDSRIYPEQIAAAATAVSGNAPAASGRQDSDDYFPAHFPAPSGSVADQPPTF